MLFAEVAAASRAITATAARGEKTALLARCLRDAADDPDELTLGVVVAYLSGELRQRRTGLGPVRCAAPPPRVPAVT